ncbi:hypothetical protein RyT2_00290 [Pseudolactococcus yaeyamensis]
MKKLTILKQLKAVGVIAVVRGATKTEAIQVSNALVAGGVTGLEITFTVPQADQVIAELADKYKDNAKVVIGAGTVLDVVTADLR